MKQATIRSGQGIGTVSVGEAPVPAAGPGEALVRLHAATLNYRDLIVAKGLIPGIGKEPEVVPLSCGAGEVVAVGDGVKRVRPGDRITPIFATGWIDGPRTVSTMLGGSVDGVARQYAVFPADSLCRTRFTPSPTATTSPAPQESGTTSGSLPMPGIRPLATIRSR